MTTPCWTRVARFVVLAASLSACDKSTGPRTGSLAVTINGLPAEIPAVVQITTPKQTTLTATATKTFSDLEPGTYQIFASSAANDRSTFSPTSSMSSVEVLAGKTPTQAVVSYSVITGIVAVSVMGVPAGASPIVTISGNGIQRTITAAGDIGNLAPATYSFTIGTVDANELYGGIANPTSVTIVASVTPVPVAVTYTAITGSLTLLSSGLPAGTVATWDLVGPNGFTRSVSGSGSVVTTHLPPGQYSVTARNALVGGDTYGSSGASVVTVTAGQSTPLTSPFILLPPSFNMTVAGAYLVQSVQNFTGTVPLIAGRDAYLRVFVRANETNAASPQVRVRFYRNGQVVATQTIAAPTSVVPVATSEANATDSWAAVINGSMIQPGTSVLVDVDPDNMVRETSDSDNQYPGNGTPLTLDIRNVAPVNIRFVPIATADGLVGNVTAARLGELISLSLRMHPMSAILPDVRAAYSTANVFVTDDANNAWSKMLNEIEVLRVTEGTGSYYVGIVKNNGQSKWGGMGYVPGKSTVSLDYAPAVETIAHELGHNWGRHHAPCGDPGGPDPSYPHAGGLIGRYGFDQPYGRILPPSVPDVMSYCSLQIGFNVATPRQWVSDYTYTGVLNFRASRPTFILAEETVEECLIVWGRITPAGIVLEPAFNATTKAVLPARPGRFNLRARDAEGNLMYSASFDPQEIADGPPGEGHFVFAIPVSQMRSSRPATLSVGGGGLPEAILTAPDERAPAPSISMTSSSRPGFVRLRWDARATPLLVVTDPVTREIISLARSGDVEVRTSRSSLVIKASNGAGSIDMQVRH